MARKRIYCPACRAGQTCTLDALADLLRLQGMLRREAEPDASLILPLLESALPKCRCPECGSVGLREDLEFADDGTGWDDWNGVACEVCGKPIPPERLEIFPDASRCAGCQDQDDAKDAADFCPRCGDLMTLRPSGRGITRYASYCPSCRR